MSKIITLNRNSDFRRLYNCGKCSKNPALVTYVKKNRAGICRIGITVSKKIGNAVMRNRSKRIIRAAYTQCLPDIQGNWDIVFVARSKTPYLKSTDIYNIMVKQFSQLDLISKG
ncbi:MAG: ribonuclease P protein component [Clostridiales bacterium]|nr:ribonuclease P protein component [Clostridiales bacterium]